jgi:hypothetical protein
MSGFLKRLKQSCFLQISLFSWDTIHGQIVRLYAEGQIFRKLRYVHIDNISPLSEVA